MIGIDQLAAAVGITRRAVRFYVQQGLLPPPQGRGRGAYYETEHLDRLRQVVELQAAGHSLEAIGKILRGEVVPGPVDLRDGHARRRQRSAAQLYTRLSVAEGVELHVDAGRYNPTPEQLLAAREAVRKALGLSA